MTAPRDEQARQERDDMRDAREERMERAREQNWFPEEEIAFEEAKSSFHSYFDSRFDEALLEHALPADWPGPRDLP